MTTTTHLGITLVEQSQAQKEVTVNAALTRIDAVLNNGAKDKDLSAPPGSPASGDLYIVAGSPTGAWSAQAGKLAYFDQLWRFITPGEGMSLWVNDEDLIYTYNGSAWVASTLGETNTASNLGSGSGVYVSKSGVDLRFKSLVAGSNITLTPSSTEITIAASGGGGVSDGDKGDITVSSSGTLWTVDNDAVTFAKMQNISTARLLGRTTASSGDVEELTVGTGLAFSSGTLNLAGGRQTVYIPAAAMRPSQTGGCAVASLIATSANHPDMFTLDFDASTAEYAQFSLRMPKAWNESTITALCEWSHASTATNFGVVWGVQAVGLSDGDSIDAAFGTAQTVTDTGGAANTLYKTAETSAITIAGSPAELDTVYVRVYRDATNGSDTLAVDARLHGVALFITTNAGTDD